MPKQSFIWSVDLLKTVRDSSVLTRSLLNKIDVTVANANRDVFSYSEGVFVKGVFVCVQSIWRSHQVTIDSGDRPVSTTPTNIRKLRTSTDDTYAHTHTHTASRAQMESMRNVSSTHKFDSLNSCSWCQNVFDFQPLQSGGKRESARRRWSGEVTALKSTLLLSNPARPASTLTNLIIEFSTLKTSSAKTLARANRYRYHKQKTHFIIYLFSVCLFCHFCLLFTLLHFKFDLLSIRAHLTDNHVYGFGWNLCEPAVVN